MSQGFEFTPGGVRPMQEPAAPAGTIINARDAIAQMQASAPAQAAHVAPSAPARAAAPAPIKRASLVKEIRGRLRDIERALKDHERLKREATQLRRMLAAAKQPPATVADIHKSRKSG
ncbi:MAG TPA: hypothetical protein VM686_31085 [Polyangiaceae bacterium]|nr:hypothetical protein [Polyangiaceae bacterium]